MSTAKTQNDTQYKTADMYLAAYLKTAGVPFLGTEREGRRVIFIFENGPTIRDLKHGYFTRTERLPALTFVDEIKAMKHLTYETP